MYFFCVCMYIYEQSSMYIVTHQIQGVAHGIFMIGRVKKTDWTGVKELLEWQYVTKTAEHMYGKYLVVPCKDPSNSRSIRKYCEFQEAA